MLLIRGVYEQHGIHLEPTDISLWAMPTAIAAFVIHAVRIAIFQARLKRRLARARTRGRSHGGGAPRSGSADQAPPGEHP